MTGPVNQSNILQNNQDHKSIESKDKDLGDLIVIIIFIRHMYSRVVFHVYPTR